MWNINLRRGAIWSTKSLNEVQEYEKVYEGMTNGHMYVLLVSVFTDPFKQHRCTYFKMSKCKPKNRLYEEIQINDKTWYVLIENLYSGDVKALDEFISSIPFEKYCFIVNSAKEYFNLKPCKKENYIESIKKPVKTEPRSNLEDFKGEVPIQKIHKFGIDILVKENSDVTITKSNRICLSESAKLDIVHNSKTDEDLKLLSDKYKIYPVKAIREIRNRLVYQYKHK